MLGMSAVSFDLDKWILHDERKKKSKGKKKKGNEIFFPPCSLFALRDSSKNRYLILNFFFLFWDGTFVRYNKPKLKRVNHLNWIGFKIRFNPNHWIITRYGTDEKEKKKKIKNEKIKEYNVTCFPCRHREWGILKKKYTEDCFTQKNLCFPIFFSGFFVFYALKVYNVILRN